MKWHETCNDLLIVHMFGNCVEESLNHVWNSSFYVWIILATLGNAQKTLIEERKFSEGKEHRILWLSWESVVSIISYLRRG